MTFPAFLFLEGSASLRVPQGRTRLCLFTLCSTGCLPVISVTDTKPSERLSCRNHKNKPFILVYQNYLWLLDPSELTVQALTTAETPAGHQPSSSSLSTEDSSAETSGRLNKVHKSPFSQFQDPRSLNSQFVPSDFIVSGQQIVVWLQ